MNNNNLWVYDVIVNISPSISMVQNRYNGQLMIRKLSAPECFPLYQRIRSLHSEHLMKIYDVRMYGELCESLCEYVPGYTLDYLVERNGPFNEEHAKKIMLSLCDGLKVLHSNGIIHKDIKPSNIIMNPEGCVKIIDYDISRTKKPDKNKDTSIFGTKGYASPEHFGFAQTDEKADIYSCGVLFNYLLTGKEPDEYLYDGSMKYIILQCTEIDKEKRFKNTDRLKEAISGEYTPVPSDSFVLPDSDDFRPLPGFRGKNVFLKILMTIIIAAYLLLFYFYIYALITNDPGISSWSTTAKVLNFIIFFFCFTLLPYILFGDIGRISKKINPKNPRNGKYVLNILGVLSIILGFLLIFIQVQ